MGQGIQVQAQTHNKLYTHRLHFVQFDVSVLVLGFPDPSSTFCTVCCVSVLVLGFPDPSSTFCTVCCVSVLVLGFPDPSSTFCTNPGTSTDTQQTVQNVDDESGNPSTSTDTQQTVQNVDDESGNSSTSTDTQQTHRLHFVQFVVCLCLCLDSLSHRLLFVVCCVSVLVLGFPDPSSTFCSLLCVCACTWIP
jgi:hypothetical protein